MISGFIEKHLFLFRPRVGKTPAATIQGKVKFAGEEFMDNLRGKEVSMCDTSNITVGTIVMVKVGRNEIEVVVTEITANGWKVKKVGSDREFIVTRIERVIAEPGAPEAVPATEPEAEEEVDTPNPAPESGGSPEKKLSLLNAALQVLKRSRTPLNTKEILAQVIEEGLWSPNGAKTPEQSLYSAFFREIKEKETPRVRKSAARRGAFEFNS